MRISDWSSDVCSSALAFLQHLARRVLAVVHQLVGVDRLVLLSVRGVDADLAEQAFHAEGARLVGDDRPQPRADLLFPEDRQSVGSGKGVSGRVDLGGRGTMK